jgi:hypothetical protein
MAKNRKRKKHMKPGPSQGLDFIAASRAIALIKALDLRITEIEEIKELLTPVFRGYVVEAPRFEPGIDLFRLQICDRPNNISRMLYPPPAITGIGRANRPGEPVLYCSTARQAPFFESKPTEGQTVVIVHWATTAPLQVNHVGYCSNAFNTLGSNRSNAGWGPRPAAVPGSEANHIISEFLANTFTKIVPNGSEHDYKLSVAIAEKMFADDFFNGLLYPAIAMKANADNFAIKPRFANSQLRFIKAEFARIDAVRDFSYDITVLDTATELSSDGSIQWKGRLDQWVMRNPGEQLTFTAEDGVWVARDGSGNIVEPE